jgi:CRP-like cAMP-binding protein
VTVNEWISSKVRAAAVERKLEAGKALFHSGSKTVGLYEVLNGTVCLVRTDRSGREAILQRASATSWPKPPCSRPRTIVMRSPKQPRP